MNQKDIYDDFKLKNPFGLNGLYGSKYMYVSALRAKAIQAEQCFIAR